MLRKHGRRRGPAGIERWWLVGTLAMSLNLGLFHGPKDANAQTARRIVPGDQYRVVTKNTLKGHLLLPRAKGMAPENFPLEGVGLVKYRERALAADEQGQIGRVLRLYDTLELKRKVKDEDQVGGLRPAVRRVILQRRDNVEIPFSPDGPLQWSEIDLIRTDCLLSSLEGFLPTGNLVVGSRWQATRLATVELTTLSTLESGSFLCEYQGLIDHESSKLGLIAFGGTVIGATEEGRSRNHVRGAIYLDPATQRLQYLRVQGKRELLDDRDQSVGNLEVDFQLATKPIVDDPELSDSVVRTLPTAPTDENTALVYEHPGLGIKLLHPRRWFLASVQGNQLLLTKGENSVVIHLERAGETPSTKAYRDEVSQYLAAQRFPIRATSDVEEAPPSKHGRLGHFAFDVQLEGKPVTLDYWAVERGQQGATLAARLASAEAATLQRDIQFLARQLAFFKPAQPIGPPTRMQTPNNPGKKNLPVR